MKIYVVGGHGFIGKKLLPRLKDHDVTVIDPVSGPVGAYEHWPVPIGHVPSQDFSRGLFVHLASKSQHTKTINESRRDLDAYLHTVGAAATLQSGVIVASTAAVSGGSTPIALYARAAEVYSAAFKPYCRIGFARIHSVYGPGQHNNLIQRLFNAALTGDSVDIYDPHFIRDWISVYDVVDSLVHQITTYTQKGYIVPVCHVGTGSGLPVDVAISKIRTIVNRPIVVRYTNTDTKNEPVVSVAQKLPSGWIPQTKFESGIRELWEWTASQRGQAGL